MSVIPSKLGALSIPIMLNACMISLYPIVIPFSHSVSFFAANSSNCSLIHSAFIIYIVLLSLTCSTSSHSLSPLCASFHYLIFAIGPLIMFSMPVHVLYLVNICRLLCHCFGSYDIRGYVYVICKVFIRKSSQRILGVFRRSLLKAIIHLINYPLCSIRFSILPPLGLSGSYVEGL